MDELQLIDIFFGIKKFKSLPLHRKLLLLIPVFITLWLITSGINCARSHITTYFKNKHARSQIYLNLVESNRTIPLNKDYEVIHTSYEIKKDIPISLKFSLTQNNDVAPTITMIIVKFPNTATVKTSPSSGWEWKKTFSTIPKEEYYIDVSRNILAKGAVYTFPSFNIAFTDVRANWISYKICIDKIGEVKHTVILSPEKYQKTVEENSAPTLATPISHQVTPDVESLFDPIK